MPDWRDIVISSLDALPKPKNPRSSIAVNFPLELQAVVLRAAVARDLSLTAYMRRCALAVAAHDLELDWVDMMALEPALRRFNDTTRPTSETFGGRGFGPWKIVTMEVHDDAGSGN